MLKKILFFFFIISFLSLPAQLPFSEDFETDGNGTRYTADADRVCNTTDYFGRVNDSQINGGTDYSNENGIYYWAGESLDDVVNGSPGTCSANNGQTTKNLVVGPINISTGGATLQVQALFGARQGTNWEGTEGMSLSYSFDNTSYTPGIFFAPVSNPDLEIREGGIESGTALGLAMSNFSFNVTRGTNTQMWLRVTMTNEGSSEELAVDLIQVDDAPLPIDLIRFEGHEKAETIELNWVSASETQNKGFELQHSKNGRDWQFISFIEGNGDSFEKQAYHFVHKRPVSGKNYYRLKQIDFDGTFEYSPVISVEIIDPYQQIIISPNPVHEGMFILQLPEHHAEIVKMTVYDYSGQILQQSNITNQQTAISTTDWRKGIYLIKAEIGQDLKWARVLIQ